MISRCRFLWIAGAMLLLVPFSAAGRSRPSVPPTIRLGSGLNGFSPTRVPAGLAGFGTYIEGALRVEGPLFIGGELQLFEGICVDHGTGANDCSPETIGMWHLTGRLEIWPADFVLDFASRVGLVREPGSGIPGRWAIHAQLFSELGFRARSGHAALVVAGVRNSVFDYRPHWQAGFHLQFVVHRKRDAFSRRVPEKQLLLVLRANVSGQDELPFGTEIGLTWVF